SLQRLDTGAPLNLTQFEVQRMQTAIRTHLFNDLRDPTGPVRSATEVAINQRELANRIGASFGRIQNEALTKILNSSVSILQRLGIVPPFQIDGADIAVKFTSPLSRAQDMEDLETLQRTVGMTAQLAGPEMVASGFKLDQFPTYIATKTGVDPELVRSDEEKMAMMRQMAEMAQQQMQGGENAEPPIQ
ncbi:MAG: portal protein, partial [Candidatus Hodarchaeales archaeon]